MKTCIREHVELRWSFNVQALAYGLGDELQHAEFKSCWLKLWNACGFGCFRD